MILTFAVTGGVALQNQMDSAHAHLPRAALQAASQPLSSQLLLSPGPVTYSHMFPTCKFKE